MFEFISNLPKIVGEYFKIVRKKANYDVCEFISKERLDKMIFG